MAETSKCSVSEFAVSECTIITRDSVLRKEIVQELEKETQFLLSTRICLENVPKCGKYNGILPLGTVCPDHKHYFVGKYEGMQHLKEPFPLPVVYNFVQVQMLYSGSVKNAGLALHFPPVLREQQAEVVNSMLLGKTVLCIMPTASGKTLASISPSIIKAQVSMMSSKFISFSKYRI
jgi:hypothetical protein